MGRQQSFIKLFARALGAEAELPRVRDPGEVPLDVARSDSVKHLARHDGEVPGLGV